MVLSAIVTKDCRFHQNDLRVLRMMRARTYIQIQIQSRRCGWCAMTILIFALTPPPPPPPPPLPCVFHWRWSNANTHITMRNIYCIYTDRHICGGSAERVYEKYFSLCWEIAIVTFISVFSSSASSFSAKVRKEDIFFSSKFQKQNANFFFLSGANITAYVADRMCMYQWGN